MAGSYGLDSSSHFAPIFFDVPFFVLSSVEFLLRFTGDGLHGIVTSAAAASQK